MSRPTKPGYYWVELLRGVFTPVSVVNYHDCGMKVLEFGVSPDQAPYVSQIPESCWRGEITRKKNKPNARVRAQRRKSAEEKTE